MIATLDVTFPVLSPKGRFNLNSAVKLSGKREKPLTKTVKSDKILP
jgi:hypothetical protein